MAEDKKHPGQPKKWQTPEELQTAIDSYFESCFVKKIERDKNDNIIYDEDTGKPFIVYQQIKPFTVSGLAAFLGTNRQTLINYQDNYGVEYFDAISRAKSMIEAFAEESLFTAKSSNGIIFSLKNNYDWKDKQEIDQKISGEISIDLPSDERKKRIDELLSKRGDK